MTQEALAERADISTRYLQTIENGGADVSLGIPMRLRPALACSWDELLGM